MVDAVIFDMDGLMFDSERIWRSLWGPTLAEFGLEEPPGMNRATFGTTGAVLVDAIRRCCGDGVDAEAVYREYYRVATERFKQGAPKKPGLDELLAWLSGQGVPMAVASSSPMAIVESELGAGGVKGCFAHIVSGQEVARSKPAPDIFLEAARRLGAGPARTLVLEDSFAGVRAGAAGGFVTVMVPDLHQPTDEVRALATRVCSDLHEVRRLLEAGEL